MGGQWTKSLWAALFFALYSLGAIAQPVAFEVPDYITFAGQKLTLTPGARAVIQKHGQYLVKNPKFYRSMTERADAYFPLIERTFAQEGLPDDFKFLAIQESGLTSDVTSRSQAVGYWQFKAETAAELGLRVDQEVDERMHILASSRAAAKYISKNNQFLNNWTFALLSYYAGLGGCRALVRSDQMGATEMELDTTTHFYILKFLAHKLAFEQAVNRSPNPVLSISEYPECEGKTLRQIAAETNVDIAQIEFYNKWCRNGIVPNDRDYTVIIPIQAGQQPSWMAMTTRPTPQLGDNLKPYKEKYFFGLFERDPEPTTPGMSAEAPVFFRWNGIKAILARKADNINKLALAAGISKEELMEYNDLRVFDLIVPGQVYYVKSKRRKAHVPFHSARSGETLWEVAQNYGITLDALLRKNRMNAPEKLAQGRILWLRHIRPEDHPIEYDPAMKTSPEPLPVTRSLPSPAIASVSSVPASAVVTSSSPAIRSDANAPTLPELKEKYADVTANEKADQITEPLVMDSTASQTTTQNLNQATVSETTKATPAPVIAASSPAAVPAPKPKAAPATLPKKAGTHIVQPKETLYSIAREHGVMVGDIKALNPGAEQGLQPGQELNIPEKGDLHYLTDIPSAKATVAPKPLQTASAAPATDATSSLSTYTVVAGDTFYSLSRRFGLTVEDIKALNDLADAPLSIGQVLKVKK